MLFSLLSREELLAFLADLPYRIPVLLISITLHEYFHAFAAVRLGDPTPRTQQRLSLNPLNHLDPIGTVMLLLVGVGWAKPVYISPVYFKNRKRDTAIVSVAGPLTNFSLAAVSLFLSSLLLPPIAQLGVEWLYTGVDTFFYWMIIVNAMLGIFNLIPVPPLDGSKILAFFLNDKAYYKYLRYENYGYLILILLLVLGWLMPIISFLARYILIGLNFVFGNAGSFLGQLLAGLIARGAGV